MSTAVEAKTYTCKVTIVTPGSSDRVIKISPATAESEKIFLDHTPGVERWAEVKRLMFNHAVRGSRVPDPVAYHSGSDLSTVAITDADIPVCQLDGVVFEVAPKKVRNSEAMKLAGAKLEDRMAKLEANVEMIAAALQRFVPAAQAPAQEAQAEQPAKRSPGRPKINKE